jgi:hypothetical protein
MLQLIVSNQLPDNRDLERLTEFCEGVVKQQPNLELHKAGKLIHRYIQIMEIGVRQFNVEKNNDKLQFKFNGIKDYYLTINHISKN